MKTSPLLPTLLALTALAASIRAAPPPEDIAMVVGAKTPVESVSLGELRKILLGDRQFWDAGQRITLLMRAPVAPERDALLRKVYKMNETQFRQYWVAKVFRADAPAGPKVVYSNQTALDLVANVPGAVAFVRLSEVPRGAKIVKIDGRAPGEKGYPLQ